MSQGADCRFGEHAEFVELYEPYLHAVYGAPGPFGQSRYGRDALVRGIVDELESRGIGRPPFQRLLDCAAGTGFPTLDLKERFGDALTVHCSDGDLDMLGVLEAEAKRRRLPLESLIPQRRPDITSPPGLEGMLIDWRDLDQVFGQYDLVICRGNSLAYADTWSGAEEVASKRLIERYLARMINRVRPGGYLLVDAPWTTELAANNYQPLDDHLVWEQVKTDRRRREWWLTVTTATGSVQFKRYSSMLTIRRVRTALNRLGMSETDPFQLRGERKSWGTIIARKPFKDR